MKMSERLLGAGVFGTVIFIVFVTINFIFDLMEFQS